jgi:type IV secretory pathway TraG/TraD family ATPase VirD4
MQGQGVLFGQVSVVFGIVIAGVWIATQWTAAALGYQLRLGSPWFDFFGTPVYHPWRLFEWWFFFDAYAPRVFDTGGACRHQHSLSFISASLSSKSGLCRSKSQLRRRKHRFRGFRCSPSPRIATSTVDKKTVCDKHY